MEGTEENGVRVSIFDDSVENHFKAMDAIAELCEDADCQSLDDAEIHSLTSSVTFLREWRHFNYKQRVVRFATEIGEPKAVSSGIDLPQFSSATVPRTEGSTIADSSNDFVMYVGGSVWGLDWCPRVHERPNCHVKCEFVAIAAHPPDTHYHKMGVPLTGRGMVQIWCVLNVNGNEEEVSPPAKKSKRVAQNGKETDLKRPKGRPRKKPPEECLNNEPKRPRGRPRKTQVEESANGEPQFKRPKGRLKKNPMSELLDDLDSTNQVQPLAIQYPEDSTDLLAIEGDSSSNQKDDVDKKKGRKPKSSISSCNPDIKTTVRRRKLTSKAGARSDSDDVVCMPLEAANKVTGSSNMSHQMIENSEKDPAVLNCISENVSLDTDFTSYSITKDGALPRVVLCLAHNGKVAWDVKWRPFSVSDSRFRHRMGYLAVLLGNGSLEVWDVPLPRTMKCIYSSSHKEGTDPRFVKMEPVFRCSILKCGEARSIPLTVEWSTSSPHDYLLAGCHDGTVALWKFSANGRSGDTRPLLCFSADTVPIRAIAWAPVESDQQNANVIVTAGHEGLKFWDIRDPFRPLWDLHPSPRFIYSLDWLPEPRCIVLSFDDGTMRLFSLMKAAFDGPVCGIPSVGPKQQGMHIFNHSSFAIWSVHVSRLTGMVAYCNADGAVCRFQLTTKAVEKDPSRNRAPHFICWSLSVDESAVMINTPLPGSRLTLKKPVNDSGENPRSLRACLLESNQAKEKNSKKAESRNSDNQLLALCCGDDPGMESGSDDTLAAFKSKWKQKSKSTSTKKVAGDRALLPRDEEQGDMTGYDETSATTRSGKKPTPKSNNRNKAGADKDLACRDEEQDLEGFKVGEGGAGSKIEGIPPKIVAMHRVRWNMNKGSERWLCSGGAAGIVRCSEIVMTDVDKDLARMR